MIAERKTAKFLMHPVHMRSLYPLRPRAAPFVPPLRQTAHGPYATYRNVGRKLGYGYIARDGIGHQRPSTLANV